MRFAVYTGSYATNVVVMRVIVRNTTNNGGYSPIERKVNVVEIVF
ncbi:MAG: hypothetical protein KatS3mg020_0270 [Fimbriimonadales bacterium]|nr:MAG: hypothetical protein KatS3mg020_0270 [Fimbriimonadales bacterium]